MAKIPRGNWSAQSLKAIRLADEYQQLSASYIADQFAVESDEIDIRSLTFKDFLRALETAERNGTREEFENRLAQQLQPIIQLAMQPPTAEGQAQ